MSLTEGWPEHYLRSMQDFYAVEDGSRGGMDSDQRAFDSEALFPLQRKRELEAMVRIARSRNPQVMCEIGADKGAGVHQWVKCLNSIKVMVAIEPRGCPYATYMQHAFPAIDFRFLPQPSQRVVHLCPSPIDVLFLDGEKLGFLRDFDTYSPLVRSGGIVFMHDINGDDPDKAFLAVQQRGYRCERIIDMSEYTNLVEKGITNPRNSYEGWLLHWKGWGAGVGVVYMD